MVSENYKLAVVVDSDSKIESLVAVPVNDDGTTDYEVNGATVVVVPEDVIVPQGGTYEDGEFVPPPLPELPDLVTEEE